MRPSTTGSDTKGGTACSARVRVTIMRAASASLADGPGQMGGLTAGFVLEAGAEGMTSGSRVLGDGVRDNRASFESHPCDSVCPSRHTSGVFLLRGTYDFVTLPGDDLRWAVLQSDPANDGLVKMLGHRRA